MDSVVISGTGLYTPEYSISNEELVAAFNTYVDRFNQDHADEIGSGKAAPLMQSSSDFIVRASGIHSRHVVEKDGILDPDIMRPQIETRADDEPSLMCEMGMHAATQALAAADRGPDDVDAVIVACSNLARPYPAISVELQHNLGAGQFGFDMNVACASAVFAIQTAVGLIRAGNADRVLVVNPEICSAHLNFRDRDSHFIFGDACTAVLLERENKVAGRRGFDILSTRVATRFSSNIRNNFGFLNRVERQQRSWRERLFVQQGRKVFKDVVPIVTDLIQSHLNDHGLTPPEVRRYWLHQANLNMNQLICRKLLGRDAAAEEAPVVLDEYANTSSAGSLIALHKYQHGLDRGDVGVLSAFGAGYSAGSVILRRR